jgi:hypothetical protein
VLKELLLISMSWAFEVDRSVTIHGTGSGSFGHRFLDKTHVTVLTQWKRPFYKVSKDP